MEVFCFTERDRFKPTPPPKPLSLSPAPYDGRTVYRGKRAFVFLLFVNFRKDSTTWLIVLFNHFRFTINPGNVQSIKRTAKESERFKAGSAKPEENVSSASSRCERNS